MYVSYVSPFFIFFSDASESAGGKDGIGCTPARVSPTRTARATILLKKDGLF